MIALVLVTSLVFLCGVDLWCKAYIEKHFKSGEEQKILGGKICVRKVHNEGIAFNIGDKRPQTVRAASGIVCVILGVYYAALLRRPGNLMQKKGMTWVLAGAFSNLYDRFVRKYVVDYFGFQTKWKKVSDITFNLGDMFIFAGTIVLLIAELCGKKK